MTAEDTTQQALLATLADGRALGVNRQQLERIETHISVIYLAGDYAYKLKKAVDLGFVDFTTLERRRQACHEELRLNTRLAPEVYLRVVSLTGTATAPELDGSGAVLDYAVVMQRFPQSALFSRMLTGGRLHEAHIEELARRLADFHNKLPAAAADSPYGSRQAVSRRTAENLEALPRLLPDAATEVAALHDWTAQALRRLGPVIDRRRIQGRVRECHGDLHLDNIIHWHDRVMAFDGIEFDPDLRWIDVANELAFVTMDLDDRDAPAFARQLRNSYLEHTGDYDALAMLGFYQVYRALVRAKINALQAEQQSGLGRNHHGRAVEYLELARTYTRPHRPALVLMHGVSGTGKSTLAQSLVRRRGYLRLRSDVVRKRLFGLGPEASSAAAGKDIYTAEASRRTYQRMAELARTALEAGYSVVLDATFLKRAHRQPFIKLAEEMGLPWRIVALHGGRQALRERVARRVRQGADPSEADVQILEQQFEELESLQGKEADHALVLDIEGVPRHWDRDLPG